MPKIYYYTPQYTTHSSTSCQVKNVFITLSSIFCTVLFIDFLHCGQIMKMCSRKISFGTLKFSWFTTVEIGLIFFNDNDQTHLPQWLFSIQLRNIPLWILKPQPCTTKCYMSLQLALKSKLMSVESCAEL